MPQFTDLEVRVREFVRKARREEGATAVEYGLMVALIAVVIIVAVTLLGNNVADTFSEVANSSRRTKPESIHRRGGDRPLRRMSSGPEWSDHVELN